MPRVQPKKTCVKCGAEKAALNFRRPDTYPGVCQYCVQKIVGTDKQDQKRQCAGCGEYKLPAGFLSAAHAECRVCTNAKADRITNELVEKHRTSKLVKKELVREVQQQVSKLQESNRNRAKPVAAPDKELAARVLSRRRLIPFIKRFNDEYEDGWVHRDVARRLERFAAQIQAKQSPRLMLLLPPRTGKSELGSRNFPAWYLGQNPKHEVVAASYSGALSLTFSRKVREIVRNPSYASVFPECKLDPDSQALENWMTTEGGSYTAVGVGGSLTGKGAHCVPLWQQIQTPAGPKTLGELIKGCGQTQHVIAYADSNVRQCEITGYVLREADHYYRVVLADGTYFDATGEHPVCVGFEGARPVYRRVDDLRPGEELATLHRAATTPLQALGAVSGVPGGVHPQPEQVPRRAAGVRGALTLLLGRLRRAPRDAAHYAAARVRGVWQGLREGRVGAGAQDRAGRHPRVLLEFLLRGVPLPDFCGRGEPPLQSGQTDVHAVRGGFFTAEERRPCGAYEDAVLQSGVLWELADYSAYPEGHAAPWGEVLPSRVSPAQGPARGGQALVHRVRRPGQGSSPPGRGPGEQRAVELGAGLPRVSSQAPPEAAATRVERIVRVDGPVTVGDLEIDGAHNFLLPNNLLLHNCLILDDCVKDQEAADSQIIRDATFDWYMSTARTRLAPGGGLLIIMTWWHDDDIAGRLQQAMKEGGEQFEVVKYPAINEGYAEWLAPDDRIVPVYEGEEPPAGGKLLRPEGTALHPERYDLDSLLALKQAYVASGKKRIWQALYQQNPMPDEGLFFEKAMFRYYESKPDLRDARIIQAWDFAITEKQTSDWTVGITIAQTPEDEYYVLDVRRFRSGDSTIIVDAMLDFYVRHKAFVIGVEDGQIWKTLAAQFQRRVRERLKLRTIHAAPSTHLNKPLTDKQVRASPLRGAMQMGRVWFPKNGSWFDPIERELLTFPASKHDDCVDSLSWTVHTALAFSAPKAKDRKPKPSSWRDKLKIAGLAAGVGHMAA